MGSPVQPQIPVPVDYVLGSVPADLLSSGGRVEVVRKALTVVTRLGKDFAGMQPIGARYTDCGYLRIDPSVIVYSDELNARSKVIEFVTLATPDSSQAFRVIVLVTCKGTLVVERIEFGQQTKDWKDGSPHYLRTAVGGRIESFGDDELETLLTYRPDLTKDLVGRLAGATSGDVELREGRLRRYRSASDQLNTLHDRIGYSSHC